MLKFLTWLLVPALPLGGLILGCWLNSFSTPVWQMPIGKDDVFVRTSKDDSFVLLAEVTPNGVIAFKGIDLIHGQQAFRSQVYQPGTNRRMYLKNQLLTDDDSSILLNLRDTDAIEVAERYQLVRYDLQKQQIVQRFLPTRRNVVFSESCMSNSVLMTVGNIEGRVSTDDLNGVCNLYFWDVRSSAMITEMPCRSIPEQIGISYDGSFAHAISYDNQHRLELFDVHKQSRIQLIPGEVTKVVWARDQLSFLALEYQPSTRTYLAHRYQKHADGEFGLMWSRELDHVNLVNEIGPGSAYFMGSTELRHSRWRSRVREIIGDRMDFILNRLWPEGQEWLVIDKETGDVVHRFLDGREGMGKPVPLHQCQGYLQFGPEVMEYWRINPFARHYPILGLFVGFLLSTLLAWKLLRHAPRASKVPATT